MKERRGYRLGERRGPSHGRGREMTPSWRRRGPRMGEGGQVGEGAGPQGMVWENAPGWGRGEQTRG